MPLSVQKIQYRMLAVALSVALVVCAVLHPTQARAASTDLDYIETTEDIGTIKAELVALPAAALAIVLGIIGFIALTYVVARNVSVPIEYSPGASFWDKCTELGQYCFDNATQALAPVFASVKQFVDDNPQLGTWGALGAFTALNVTKFFTAFSNWLSSTFLGAGVTTTAAGLMETAKHTEVAWSEYGPLGVYEQYGEYPYYSAITSALVQYDHGAYSGVINPAHIFGYYYQDYLYGTGFRAYYQFYEFLPAVAGVTLIIVAGSNGSVSAGIYETVGTNLNHVALGNYCRVLRYYYNSSNTRPGSAPTYADVEPNRVANNNLSVITGQYNIVLGSPVVGYTGEPGVLNSPSLRDPVSKFLSLAILAGMHIAYYNGTSFQGSIPIDSSDLNWITEVPTAQAPTYTIPRDTILNPPESIDVDLSRIAEGLGAISEEVDEIRDALEAGSTLKLLEYLWDLTSADTLTQEAVNTGGSPNIYPTPTYPIPGLGNVWKYVTYMFSTLGGWITFVGNCLQAVTVGEGGLSWIFYGAFIFIICGGFIGKLLL